MSSMTPLQGDLQIQVMKVLWNLETGSVEDVRNALPPRYRGAYTTIQTILNRLSDRGMVTRRRLGKSIEYRPRIAEAEYVSRAITQQLSAASSDARQAAIAALIGSLESDELSEIRRIAKRTERDRRQ